MSEQPIAVVLVPAVGPPGARHPHRRRPTRTRRAGIRGYDRRDACSINGRQDRRRHDAPSTVAARRRAVRPRRRHRHRRASDRAHRAAPLDHQLRDELPAVRRVLRRGLPLALHAGEAVADGGAGCALADPGRARGGRVRATARTPLGRPLPFIEVDRRGRHLPAGATSSGPGRTCTSTAASAATRRPAGERRRGSARRSRADRDSAYSRLLCPRILSANTALSRVRHPDVRDRPAGRPRQGPGRRGVRDPERVGRRRAPTPEPDLYPVYHRWYFRTGDGRRLRVPRPAARSRGRSTRRSGGATIDVLDPGSQPAGDHRASAASCASAARCARRSSTLSDEELGRVRRSSSSGPSRTRTPFQTALAALVNLAADYSDQTRRRRQRRDRAPGDRRGRRGPADRPAALRPLARRRCQRLDPGRRATPSTRRWVDELNLDPRHRVAAGLRHRGRAEEPGELHGGRLAAGRQGARGQQHGSGSASWRCSPSMVWHRRELAMPVEALAASGSSRVDRAGAPARARRRPDVAIACRRARSRAALSGDGAQGAAASRPRVAPARLRRTERAHAATTLIDAASTTGRSPPRRRRRCRADLPTGPELADQLGGGRPAVRACRLAAVELLRGCRRGCCWLLVVALVLALLLLLVAGGRLGARRRGRSWRRWSSTCGCAAGSQPAGAGRRARASTPDTHTPASGRRAAGAAPTSTIVPPGGTGARRRRRRGRPDSADGRALQGGAAQHLRRRRGRARRSRVVRAPLPLDARHRLGVRRGARPGGDDPERVLGTASRSRRGSRHELVEDFGEVMVYPEIDIPMYEPLKDISSELLPAQHPADRDQHHHAARDQPEVHRGLHGRAQPRVRPRAALARVPDRPARQLLPPVLGRRAASSPQPGADPEALRERLRDIPELHRWSHRHRARRARPPRGAGRQGGGGRARDPRRAAQEVPDRGRSTRTAPSGSAPADGAIDKTQAAQARRPAAPEQAAAATS